MKKLFSILSLIFILGMETQAQNMCTDSIKCDGSNFTFYLPSTNAPGNSVKTVRLDTGGASVDLTVTSRTAIGSSIIIVTPMGGLTCSDNAVTTTYLNMGGSVLGSCSTSQALPVEFLYFIADVVDDEVRLEWATASELNNSFFEIQKSTDGKQWTPFDYVPGAGNSNSLIKYSFIDVVNQSYYYRLRQVDFDGKFEYSTIAKAIYKEKELVDTQTSNVLGQQGVHTIVVKIYSDGTATKEILIR